MSLFIQHDDCTEVDSGRIPVCVAIHAVFGASGAGNPSCRDPHQTVTYRLGNLLPAHTLARTVRQVVQPLLLTKIVRGGKWLRCSFGKKIGMTCGVAGAA